MHQYELAKFIIERFDHYYDGVNNKGAFYIGLNTFIFGGICVGYLSLYNNVSGGAVLWVLFAGLVVNNVLSVLYTILALMPFLRDNHSYEEKPSLIFFGGIAKHPSSYFREKFHKTDEASIVDDLVQQAYCLARGLNQKYKFLKRAGWFVLAQFIIMLPLLLFIVKNLK